MNIVTGVFNTTLAAESAVRALMETRFDADQIGIFTRDRDKGMVIARDMKREYTDRWGNAFTSDRHIYNEMPEPFRKAIDDSNMPADAIDWYRARMNEGDILVTVRTGDRMNEAERIIEDHGGWLYGSERRAKTTERAVHATEGEIRLPVMDEEVVVEKRQHQVGEVHVTPEVTRETVDFPTEVTHQEIRVERRKLDRPLDPDEYKGTRTTEGGELRMPIIEEELIVTKRPIIREEMVITRVPVTERDTIHETVMHTEPRVETTGKVEVEGMTEEERRRRQRPAA